MLKAALLILIVFTHSLMAKALIMTHSYNRPDFIELQHKTFQKFLEDEYEFVVFNDGPTAKFAGQIEEACKRLNIRCIRVPQEIHQRPYLHRDPWEDYNSPSVRTANAIQFSIDFLGFDHKGIVAVIDSDMFLIRPFSLESYLKGYDLSAVAQWRGSMGGVKYLWNGLMFFNMDTLPNKHTLNFNCGSIKGNHTDTGGYTYYYLNENPQAKVLFMKGQLDITDGDYITDSYDLDNRNYLAKEEVLKRVESNPHLTQLINENPDDIQLYLDAAILHYRRAGNYHNKPNIYHQKKSDILYRFIKSIAE